MITWHYAHLTSEHSFNTLKRILSERAERLYTINCPKIYNPYGLASYLQKEPEKRIVITADHLNSGGMKKMLSAITKKMIPEKEEGDDDKSSYVASKNDNTLRGQKYDFIIKMMKKCNSTDIANIMIYCKNTSNVTIKENWEHIFRNTRS